MRVRPRSATRRVAALVAAALATAMCMIGVAVPPAHAVAPPTFPDGTTRTQTFSNTTPVVIPVQAGPVAVTSTIEVSAMAGVVWDVDLVTNVRHTFSADVDMTLTSPGGATVTLTTGNGGSFDNVFNGTVWDDDANPGNPVPYTSNDGLVADHVYADNVVASPLVPEESLSEFLGSNANGIWTLKIVDEFASVDGGTLDSWRLVLTTIPYYPAFSPFEASVSPDAPQVISATGTPLVTSTLSVASRHRYICDVSVVTNLTHTNSGDLDISVTSPSGTSVTLTTDNGSTFDDVFNGTEWANGADPVGQVPYSTNSMLATDHIYADGGIPRLVPEESLGAFQGEDPNGTWTLRVSDDANGSGGTLSGWKLRLLGCEFVDEFKGLTPARLLDTRRDEPTVDHLFEGGGAAAPDSVITLQISGRGGVPSSGAGAVALNVTAVSPTSSSYITVYPAGTARPVASNINAVPGQTVPNMVIVPLGVGGAADGKIVLYNQAGSTHLVVDVLGWLPDGFSYRGLSPARLLETRPGLPTVDGSSQTGQRVGAGQTIDLQISGRGGVVTTSGSVVLNVTAVAPTADTYITAFPTGQTRPLASNLNAAAGAVVPNMVIVPLGTDGKVSFFNFAGDTDLVVDVLGFFTPISSYFGLTPARLLDTRPASPTVDGLFQIGTPVGPGGHVDVTINGRGGTGAFGSQTRLVALNVTVTNPTANSYVTVYPTGVARPTASNLNVVPGVTVANMVVVPVGSDGKVTIYNFAGSVDVVVDVLGWAPLL